MTRRLLALALPVAVVAAAFLVPGSGKRPPVRPSVPPPAPGPRVVAPTPAPEPAESGAVPEFRWRGLSNAELAREAARLIAALRAGGTEIHGDLREIISSDDLTGLLEDCPAGAFEGQIEILLDDFHRVARHEHVPAYVALARETRDPGVRRVARKTLGVLSELTDRHREAIAAALLGDDAPTLPKVLARFLAAKSRQEFEADWMWMGRWLWDEPPGPETLPMLRELVRRDLWWPGIAAVRAMGFLEDEAPVEFLAATAADRRKPDGIWPYALNALARLGDAKALADLEANAVRDSTCLGLLHDLDPARAAAVLARALLAENETTAQTALDALADTLPTGHSGFGIVWDAGTFPRIEDAALRSRASGLRLARIGTFVPGARTRRLAERAARLLTERHPDPDSAGFQAWDWAPFLEVGAPEEFARMLESWKASGDADLRDAAGLLAGEVGDASVHALAVRGGLPPRVRWHRDLPEDVGEEDWTALSRSVRAGRPVDGLVALLAAHPDEPVWNLGLVDDPRIVEHLRRVRSRPDLELRAWATGELAVAGDPEARTEQWAAIREGRYRWVDEADALALTLGEDLSTIPFLIGELESNCCRFAALSGAFEDLFGIDPYELKDHPRGTAADVLREWWAEFGSRLVRSRVAGRYVPRAD